MDVIKIGKFIAVKRKERKLTQEQLGEKLGVTYKTISRWENGNYMPDISLLQPLSEELGVTLNDLLSGEIVAKEEYQEKLEENMANTIDFTSQKVNKKNKTIAQMIISFGIGLIFMAFTIVPEQSSWGSIYAVIGILISCVGIFKIVKEVSYQKRIAITFGYVVLAFVLLLGIDYANVQINQVPPRFSYLIETGDKMMIYHSPFCNVYRINRNTKNEYYIVDTKKQYTSDTVPITPFNREKSGIDSIVQYKNKYIGNNSNISNLVGKLPLSEYGYVIEIDSEKLGLNVHYHVTDWYINENHYLEKSLLYNTVSIFSLIDNVQKLTFNFSGKSYQVTRKQIEEHYPNYKEIAGNGIDKEKFNQYVENKMNDEEFVQKVFREVFIQKDSIHN